MSDYLHWDWFDINRENEFNWGLYETENRISHQLFDLVKDWSELDSDALLIKINEYSSLLLSNSLDANGLLESIHYIYWMLKSCEKNENNHLLFATSILLNCYEIVLIRQWTIRYTECCSFKMANYRSKNDFIKQKIDHNRLLISKFKDKIFPYFEIDVNVLLEIGDETIS